MAVQKQKRPSVPCQGDAVQLPALHGAGQGQYLAHRAVGQVAVIQTQGGCVYVVQAGAPAGQLGHRLALGDGGVVLPLHRKQALPAQHQGAVRQHRRRGSPRQIDAARLHQAQLAGAAGIADSPSPGQHHKGQPVPVL